MTNIFIACAAMLFSMFWGYYMADKHHREREALKDEIRELHSRLDYIESLLETA